MRHWAALGAALVLGLLTTGSFSDFFHCLRDLSAKRSSSWPSFLPRHGRPGEVAFHQVPGGAHPLPGHLAGAFRSASSLPMYRSQSSSSAPAAVEALSRIPAVPVAESLKLALAALALVSPELAGAVASHGDRSPSSLRFNLGEAYARLDEAIRHLADALNAASAASPAAAWRAGVLQVDYEAELLALALVELTDTKDCLSFWNGMVLRDAQVRVQLWMRAVSRAAALANVPVPAAALAGEAAKATTEVAS